MSPCDIPNITDRAVARARYYMAEGYERDQAVDMAVSEELLQCQRQGLGDDLLQEAQGTAKQVSGIVSPWLWILSIIGFAMGAANKYQIQKMFGSWKRMKRQLLG